MKFSELEQIMRDQGISSLAEIARRLSTTPQAVSNWKSRDQVPYHIISSIKSINKSSSKSNDKVYQNQSVKSFSFSDVLVLLAEQLKVIVLVTFIFSFASINYNQFLKKPLYRSSATLLIKDEEKNSSLGGLAGLASQFGVSVGNEVANNDLSSPSLFPELIKSRTFAEQMLEKTLFSDKQNKKITLLEFLTESSNSNQLNDIEIKYSAIDEFQKMVSFEKKLTEKFSTLDVTTFNPIFSKELADAVLAQLEAMNRYYKSKSITEKISFINNRINSVAKELRKSEKKLKQFNESNLQISSPALELENDRLERDVEIQKGIFITLKQQLELAKIEEVQGSSTVQILDEPEIPLGPSNKNLINSVLFYTIVGLALGILLAVVRGYINNAEIEERKKIRKMKNFLRKKSIGLLSDYKFTGVVMVSIAFALPLFLGHRSKNPIFFDLYSPTALFINCIYIIILFSLIILTFKNYQSSK